MNVTRKNSPLFLQLTRKNSLLFLQLNVKTAPYFPVFHKSYLL